VRKATPVQAVTLTSILSLKGEEAGKLA